MMSRFVSWCCAVGVHSYGLPVTIGSCASRCRAVRHSSGSKSSTSHTVSSMASCTGHSCARGKE